MKSISGKLAKIRVIEQQLHAVLSPLFDTWHKPDDETTMEACKTAYELIVLLQPLLQDTFDQLINEWKDEELS